VGDTASRDIPEVIMCCANGFDISFTDLLRDPLIQLVMQSDGVTEHDMIALRDQVVGNRANPFRAVSRELRIQKLRTELQRQGVFLRMPAEASAGI
jgi:hypothetical protein